MFAKVTAHDSDVIWPGGLATESVRMAVPQRSEGRKPNSLRRSEGFTDKARALQQDVACIML